MVYESVKFPITGKTKTATTERPLLQNTLRDLHIQEELLCYIFHWICSKHKHLETYDASQYQMKKLHSKQDPEEMRN